MRAPDLLADAFGRIGDLVPATLDGLDTAALHARLDPDANPIAWLVWHLSRVQDDHVAGVAQVPERYVAGGWAARFALPFEPGDVGYGHSAAEVGLLHVPGPELLAAYHHDVSEMTLAYVAELDDDDLERIVDHSFDPPVTAGVRLVSVIGDCLEHIGQAAFIRGVLARRA